MFKYFFILGLGRIAIAAVLAIGMLTFGMLTFGAANSWAGNGGVRELVGFKDYTLYKFCEGEVDDWDIKSQGNGTVNYECNTRNGDCFIVVNAIGICGNDDILYTCDDGAVVTLNSSSVLIVPDDCEGVCGNCDDID